MKLKKLTVLLASVVFLFASCGNVGGGNDNPTVVPTGEKFTPADTSKQMALNMAMGWNLGNYLDSTNWEKKQNAGLGVETEWRGQGAPKVSQAMITTVHNAGFKSIRMPVSWHNHVSNASDYTIDSAWMARVKEVVDYAYNEDMCVIINVHHDNLSESEISSNLGYVISKDSALQTKSKAYLQSVWKQIAEAFADYDNKLVFEVLNEPRCVGTGVEWNIYDNSTPLTASAANGIIMEYEKVCIDAIRGTGGNNETRYLVVPSYAGSANVTGYNLPADSAEDRLIYSFHAYSPYQFAMYSDSNPNCTKFLDSYKNDLKGIFGGVRTKFGYDVGIIIGEASCENKGNLDEREKWFTYYFKTAYYDYKMPTFLWDNGVSSVDGSDGKWNGERHGYLNVSNNTWYFPTLIQKAKEAIYGSN